MTITTTRRLLLNSSIITFSAFLIFSYLVAKETFNRLDFDLTVKFQDNIPHHFDTPFSWLSVLGSAEVSLTIWLGITIYLALKKYWLTFFTMSLLPIALVIEIFGKLFIHHPGPPYMFYRGTVNFDFPSHFVKTDYAYPSGHMIRTTFLATFIITYLLLHTKRKAQLITIPLLLIFIVMMTISRIYLGEHWTTDVIGGLLLGAACGIFSGITLPKIREL